MTFEKLNLIAPILRSVKLKGYTSPTPIQEQSIPIILKRRDLLGCAQTGTGKTAAFAIPTLQILHEEREAGRWPRGIKALVLTPTRELAAQIEESFRDYGRGLGIRHTVIFGGVKQFGQVRKIKAGVDVLIATPGRLLDLMNQGIVKLGDLKIFTLDEADRMLDMGFIHDIKKVIQKLPKKRQSLFFSATMPASITDLAHSLLTNPQRVEVAPVSSTAESVEQKLFLVDRDKKRSLLKHVLESPEVESALVFTRTKHGADKLTKFINTAGFRAEAIHGNKSQSARQKALKNFKDRRTKILVATDIAARGIDVRELSHVINFEIPNEPETYVHRIGRTGRAENTGMALSFCDGEELGHIRGIHRLINKEIPLEEDHPYPMKKMPTTKPKPKKGSSRGRPVHSRQSRPGAAKHKSRGFSPNRRRGRR